MKLTQIKGRTWYLDSDAYVGVYRLEDGRCILLDSGQRWEKEEILAALTENGLTLAGIINSHIHTDHVGVSRSTMAGVLPAAFLG